MSENKEDKFTMVKDKFATMKPTEITEKLASIGRAEKVFISAFMVSLVCAAILFAMKVNVLTHDFPNLTLTTFLQNIPIWSFFELSILAAIFVINLVALVEYLSIGFVFQRKVEITRKED